MLLFTGIKFAVTIDIDDNIVITKAMAIVVAKSFFGIYRSYYIMRLGLLKWFFVKLSCLGFVKFY